MTASNVTLRFTGVNSALALKAPVRCATTGPIILFGLQTIDGVIYQASDLLFPNQPGVNKRVLVKNQTDPTQNGIYDVNTAAWTRSADWDSNDDIISGTRIYVAAGATQQGEWILTTADPITLGTSSLTLSPAIPSITAGAWNDTSAVLGNAASYYNPTYFGNPGTGIVHRFNRVMIGGAALGSSDNPQSTKDYVQSVSGMAGFSDAQLSSLSAIGGAGVFGATRTSDFFTWSGGHSGGSGAITGISINDDSHGGNPIGVAGLFIGVMQPGPTGGITVGSQIDINTVIAPFTPTVVSGLLGGSSVALILSAGAYPLLATQNASVALVIGGGNAVHNTAFRKGILFANTTLDTSVGGGGGGLAIELFRGQSLRWQNSTPTTDLEIWGNASGLVMNTYPIMTTSAAGAATPYNQMIDSAGNGALILGGGGSSPDHSNYYRNTTHTFSDIAGANYTTQFSSGGMWLIESQSTPAGGTANLGIRMGSIPMLITWGSGPPTLSAAQGSLYLRSDGTQNNRLYININGSTGWTAFNTIS